MIGGIGNTLFSIYSQTENVQDPRASLVNLWDQVRTLRGLFLVSRTGDDPPCTPPCVRSKRPRVCRQHAHTFKSMCACCRHTGRRLGIKSSCTFWQSCSVVCLWSTGSTLGSGHYSTGPKASSSHLFSALCGLDYVIPYLSLWTACCDDGFFDVLAAYGAVESVVQGPVPMKCLCRVRSRQCRILNRVPAVIADN